jgi:hypothetical protein
MNEAGTPKGSIFEGFRVGPVLAGILIAGGIETLIAAFSWPFAGVMVEAANYVIRVGRLDVVGPGAVHVSSFLEAVAAVPAIVILLCGLRLGAWLRQGKIATDSNSR